MKPATVKPTFAARTKRFIELEDAQMHEAWCRDNLEDSEPETRWNSDDQLWCVTWFEVNLKD